METLLFSITSRARLRYSSQVVQQIHCLRRTFVFQLRPPKGVAFTTNRSSAPQWPRPRLIATATLLAAGIAVSNFAWSHDAYAEASPNNEQPRKIRLSEVHEHGRMADNFWVIKGDRVYDITEWVPNHPGGEVILRAAGGNIDPYWKIFSIHQKQDVYDILEQYFIGFVDPQDLADGKVPAESIDDPFAHDPVRDKRLKILTAKPCNAETPTSALGTYITPNDVFYVRHHLWVPDIKSEDHKLTVELSDGEEKVYSMDDLRNKFKLHTITSTLQCSGNRRSDMTAGSRQTNGLQWGVGAIGNAEWTGISLRDVLEDAGLTVNELPENVKHAQFMGSEAYGASIPIDKAIGKREDVLLAFEMNGKPLPRDHGYPLRVIVPGNVAARSVKWVNKITVSEEESTSQWQRRDYKCFGPNEGSKPDWDSAPAIQEMPVQSAVTKLEDVKSDDRKVLEAYGLEEDAVALEGYAFAGGGRRIVRVDVSADDGISWDQAQLLPEKALGHKAWGWQRWKFVIPARLVGKKFAVKAVDEAYNTQPDSFEAHYNFRGNLATGWHRLSYKKTP